MKLNWKHKLFNTLKYLLISFMVLIIVMNFYLGINKAVTQNPVPKIFGITPLIVMSGSMEPVIMPGDVVVIREQDSNKYKLGDVVTYLEGQITYTHRIIAEEDGLFVLKGDNNNVTDDNISPTQLIGKVFLTIPKIGYAILYLKTLPGMIVLLLFLIIFIYGEVVWHKIRK